MNMTQDNEWWMKYAEGNWVGLSFIPKILAEQKRRTLESVREMVEGMKPTCHYAFTGEECVEHGQHCYSFALDAVIEGLKKRQTLNQP